MGQQNVTCTAVNDFLIRESGRIGPTIHKRIVNTGPWIKLTKRAEWTDEMGTVISNLMFERTLPSNDAEAWADVAPSDNVSVDNCLPPTEELAFGQSLRTFRLQKIAKNSPEFCIEDLRSSFKLSSQLQNIMANLQTVTKWVWENRNRNEYLAIAAHKVTANAGFNQDATEFDTANPPTSPLTNGILEQIYSTLISDGAGESALGMSEGVPEFGLITSREQSRLLIKQDPELRQDFRYAYMGQGAKNPMLSPLGVSRSFDGFYHMIDPFPPRYDLVGGAYVRRNVWVSSPTTKGTKYTLNPQYANAEFEVSFVYHQDVYLQRIPRPISNPGGGFKFDPVNYMGEFSWKNILHKECNPDGTKGFFRAVFASGSEPIHPEWGYAILHKRCAPLLNLRNGCYS